MNSYTVLGINEFVLRDKFSMAIKWGLIALVVVAVVYVVYTLIKRRGMRIEKQQQTKKQKRIAEKREKIEKEKFINSIYNEINRD